MELRGFDGYCVTGHRLNGHSMSSRCTANLVRTIGTVVDSVAFACNVRAGVVSAPELEIVNERLVALFILQECWDTPRRVAAHLIRAIITIGSPIAAASGTDTLITTEALEGVPIHLASTQMSMMGLAHGVLNVGRVHDEIILFARDACFWRSTASPAKCRNEREILL